MKNIKKELEYIKHIEYYEGLGRHKFNVAKLMMIFVHHLGLDIMYIKKAYLVGMLHDVGKSIIDFDILTKPEKLTSEEMETMKKHVEFGYENTAGYDSEVWRGVVEHHENFDGTGYPTMLSGDGISVLGRCARICDMYDALRSKRSYKSIMSHEAAIIEMEKDIHHLDLELFEQFKTMRQMRGTDEYYPVVQTNLNINANEFKSNNEETKIIC
ncbi:MAG: HD domain-containing protein [Clostridiales bacterium]|nr:HD domain-containing protein [Clostridiales bacterium]